MQDPYYFHRLGLLVHSLQTLEFMLRLFLAQAHSEDITEPPIGARFVWETHLTNFDPLDTLAKKFLGEDVKQPLKDPNFKRCVEIRNAVAHGRSLSDQHGAPKRLYKFKRPAKGEAELEFDELLSEEWFKGAYDVLSRAAARVVEQGNEKATTVLST